MIELEITIITGEGISPSPFLLDKNKQFSQVLKEYDGLGNSIVDYVYGDDLISQKRSSLKSFYPDSDIIKEY